MRSRLYIPGSDSGGPFRHTIHIYPGAVAAGIADTNRRQLVNDKNSCYIELVQNSVGVNMYSRTLPADSGLIPGDK
jgi:hypothetical protein